MWIQAIKAVSVAGLVSASLIAQAQDYFSQGTAAFKRGEYQRALALFEWEQQKGRASSKLSYNIGVTHFKLGNYLEAGSYFQQLTGDPEWRDLAHFQLGVIAEKQGHRSTAVGHYAEIESRADSEKLRALSSKRLAALASGESRAPAPASRQWLAVASASSGYDDNVFALQDDLLQNSTLAEDNYSELFAWGQYRLQGTAADGWRVQGSGYSRSYSEYSSLDVSSYGLGLSRDLNWNGWQAELGIAADSTFLGGEQLTRATRLIGRVHQTFYGAKLTLAYLPAHYSGGSAYAHLDGWGHRVEAKLKRPLGRLTMNALYRMDVNDRGDLEGVDGAYYSYSPARHSTALELEWPLLDNWDLAAGVEYRSSEYDGVNSLTDTDGTMKHEVREADRVRSWLKSQYHLSPRLQLAGKIALTDNEENFDIYSHDRTEASLGVRYTF
ncbi:hypothetical protein [Microbulbifer magnicolonia]|uniref:tetratricopeptide repeat protein n=1 Tax=Microbulbifer magnicolonia TaxID=3109744 RepID=UPI002B40A013|nr:hypothetical protein [Microbulbifer sp. GG15]